MTKKIIIYGVSEKSLKQRRYIEKFLDDGYEIVGYSDGHYAKDPLGQEPFFKPEDICRQQVDFVLMNSKSDSSFRSIRRYLMALGIPSEKILRPTMFLEHTEIVPMDLIGAIERQYNGEKGLIFGLSYSLKGINERDLEIPFFDCSWPSLDLYYNARIYDYMEERGIFDGVNAAFWVFPYYYFDYDFTLSSRTSISATLQSLWKLDDWHHYEDSSDSNEHIANFRMFSKRMTEFFQMPKHPVICVNVYGGADGTELLDPIWFSNHEATVSENKTIFVEFYKKLTESGRKVILVIPPFYLNGLNAVSKAAFQAKREKFYRILHELEEKTGKIPVFDYADRFAEKRTNFMDPTHINFLGAAEFTDVLNKEVIPIV